MAIELNLTNYKDRFGTNVPEGRYLVVVSDIEETESKAGNPMLTLWLDVVTGDHAGATLLDRLVVSDKTLFRWVAFMQAIGLPTPKKRLKIEPTKFIGKKLMIDVEDGEPYNGRVKSEVRGYAPVSSSDSASSESAPVDLPDEDDVADVEPVVDETAVAEEATEAAPASVEDGGDEVVELSLDDLG